MTKENIVLVGNLALAGGLLVLVGLGKLDWEQALVGIGLLAVPSALQRAKP